MEFSSSDGQLSYFNAINWGLLKNSDTLSSAEYASLERAEDFDGGGQSISLDFCTLLLKLALNCPLDVGVQRYVFHKVCSILELTTPDGSISVAAEQRAIFFTEGGMGSHITANQAYLRAIISTDLTIKSLAAHCYASLLTKFGGGGLSGSGSSTSHMDDNGDNIKKIVEWMIEELSSANVNSKLEYLMPAITTALRSATIRNLFATEGGVSKLVAAMTMIGASGNAQRLYELAFCMWSISLNDKLDINNFLTSPAIKIVSEVIAAAPSRKVVRLSVALLCNLARSEDSTALTEMFSSGLQKSLENMIQSSALKQANDTELEADARELFDILMTNFRELSTYDRWATEVKTGALRWGIVHTEKFWRENARFVEQEEYSMLKRLIDLLDSDNTEVLCIALYDIGEFTRFYAGGRGITSSLGGKDRAMAMIDHSNAEIARYALQCVSKIMVTNWAFAS